MTSRILYFVLLLLLPVATLAQGTPSIAAVEPLHVELWPDTHAASIDVYRPLAHSSLDTLVIIVPGGGFGALSPWDRQLAEFFRSEGYPAAVVNYRVLPAKYPDAFADVLRAIRLARHEAAAWNIKPARIALLGESAGGLLAAIAATQSGLKLDPRDDLASTTSARPDLLLLISPVISVVDAKRYPGVDRWLGETVSPTQREQLSPERHVNATAPPAILFHAADDPVVPYEGTLELAQAYWKAGASAELHLFPSGGHGHEFYDAPAVSQAWRQDVLRWLAQQAATSPAN